MCRSTITSELCFKMQALAHCLFFFGCGYPNAPKQFIEMPNFSSLNCPCIFAPKNDIYEWVHSLDYLLCFKKMIYMSRSTLWIIFSVSLISSLFHLYVHPFHNTILICINSRHNFVLNWHYNVEPLNPWICYVFICVFLDFFWHLYFPIFLFYLLCAEVHGVTKSRTLLSDWTTTIQKCN